MSDTPALRPATIADAPAIAATIAAAFAQYRGKLVPESGAFGETADAIAVELKKGAGAVVAEDETDEAVLGAGEAAELEAKVGKHPVTPGSVLPARELLGDLYLELERPREALAAYEEALLETPNRLRSLRGAAKSAGLAGDAQRERTFRNLIDAISVSTYGPATLRPGG